MPSLSLMFKTVSSRCDLACSYCYYRSAELPGSGGITIGDGLLERVTREYLDYVADTRTASFGWQGGEPTLAGRVFFERAVALQARLARPGTVISNDLQTHGATLDDDWARLFADYRFLVGVSLDGPQEIHDSVRKDRHGRGTHLRVMRGVEALARRGVDRNALAVVGPHNVGSAGEIFDFYVFAGFEHVQIVPQMSFQATTPMAAPSYAVSAERYGDFLAKLFDRWWSGGYPTISVSVFDVLIEAALGRSGSLCLHSDRCDGGLVIDRDGSAYPCDFYIDDEHRLGRLGEVSLSSVANGEARSRFAGRKTPLPLDCSRCPWRDLCRGGCPRNRAAGGSDVMCLAYRRLFEHAGVRIRELASRMRRLAATRVALDRGARPGRNDPCPCGSERKYKACCGHPAVERSYVFT